jgi:hypothetical protein
MSHNLVQSLERVTSTINRQIRYGAEEDNNESFRSTRTPIQKFAERLEPAARSEIIKSLSREALYEQPHPDTSIEAFRLGTLGQEILVGDTQAAVNTLSLGQDYQTARVTRALGLAVTVGKTKVVDGLISLIMRKSLDIPQSALDQMLDATFYKVIRAHTKNELSEKKSSIKEIDDTAIEIYETLLALKKSLNIVHTKDARKFTQDTTRKINDHIAILAEKGFIDFLTLHATLISKLDTSYYDSSTDKVGLAKIENAFAESDSEDKLGIVTMLENLKTVEEQNYDVETDAASQEKTRKNTRAINEKIMERIETKPAGALNIFGRTISASPEVYDIKLDPHALGLINEKLEYIEANPNYSNDEKTRMLKAFQAIIKTYNNTLNNHEE